MTSKNKQLGRIATIIIFLFVFCLSVPSPHAETIIKKGDRGTDVKKLQQDLKALGYFPVKGTGYFGPVTERSVITLQKDYYLVPDGIVGPVTSSLINKLLKKTRTSTQPREVLGFYVGDEPGIPSSLATLKAQRETITSISPFWYRLDRNNPGKIEVLGNVKQQEIKTVIDFAKNNNIENYALIHNLLYGKTTTGREVAHSVFAEPQKRWDLVMSIFKLLKGNGFDGVCVDIENIYPGDRNLFIQFLRELSAQLKPAGYKIIVCVPSKTSNRVTGGWGDSFDYAKVANYADLVVLMAYDEHTSGSKPGPIASTSYVDRVLKYGISQIPPEKILLGVSGFGFDWNLGQGSSRYLSYQMAVKTARQYNKGLQWDSEGQVPYFYYYDYSGSLHNVFIENASSLASKLDLVNKYNVRGIAIWRLGMEDPSSWPVIAGKF